MLGKGVAIVKSRLKRLSQSDDAWVNDFEALLKPSMQTETHHLGMVVTRKRGSLLADLTGQDRKTVYDLPSADPASDLISGSSTPLTHFDPRTHETQPKSGSLERQRRPRHHTPRLREPASFRTRRLGSASSGCSCRLL